jgi:hypothetical protein
MPVESFTACTTSNRPHRECHDNRIVDKADHRHEVRDDVDRRDQIGKQQKHTPTHASGQRFVRGEPPNEPDDIREQPQRIHCRDARVRSQEDE